MSPGGVGGTMKPVRVMQSFRAPRGTTNPYITMLDEALAHTEGIVHLRFHWRTALFGRYDVFHWHWPEGKLHGTTWWKSAGKYALTAALTARHVLSRRIAVVRTVHNIELPDDNRARLLLLACIDRTTDYRIILNSTTALPADQPRSLIPHGHYRNWYARCQRRARIPDLIGTFGGLRRYKNAGTLIDAYAQALRERPNLTLWIGGRPSSPAIANDLRSRTAALPGVRLDLKFLSDPELVDIATSSTLVVLAYQFMHNSGSLLAALSLDRPVLVPRNCANEALASEVGSQWVQMYEGALDGAKLLAAVEAVKALTDADRPDLSRREWDSAGRAHADVYRAAMRGKRTRGTLEGGDR